MARSKLDGLEIVSKESEQLSPSAPVQVKFMEGKAEVPITEAEHGRRSKCGKLTDAHNAVNGPEHGPVPKPAAEANPSPSVLKVVRFSGVDNKDSMKGDPTADVPGNGKENPGRCARRSSSPHPRKAMPRQNTTRHAEGVPGKDKSTKRV